jgi:hypothetical protein
MKIYIFGNGHTSYKDFEALYLIQLEKLIMIENIEFIVCDFKGIDTLVMEYLKTESTQVKICHIGERTRYTPDKYKTKVSQWNFLGGFIDDEDRDAYAIKECSHFLAFDFNSNVKRKSGTLNNIEMCESLKKIRIK